MYLGHSGNRQGTGKVGHTNGNNGFTLFCLVLFFFLFLSDDFLAAADNVFGALVLIRLAVIGTGLLFVFRLRIMRQDAFVLIFLWLMVVVGIANGNLLTSAPVSALKFVTTYFLVAYYVRNGRISSLSISYFVASCLGILVDLLFDPRQLGLYSDVYDPTLVENGPAFYGRVIWYTGSRNSFGEYFLLSTLFLLMGKPSSRTRWALAYAWNLLGLAMSIYVWSASSVVIVALILLGMFGIQTGVLRLHPYKGLAVGVIINISVVMAGVQEFMGAFIENVLHRDATFTGRTFIWSHYLERLGDHLVFGNGVYQEVIPYFGREYTPHNNILSILVAYGVTGVAIVGVALLIGLKNAGGKQGKDLSRIQSLIGFATMLFFIRGTVESVFGPVFLILGLANFSGHDRESETEDNAGLQVDNGFRGTPMLFVKRRG